MGDYYRKHFAARGLLPAKGCPKPNEVYLWADVDQRTRLTGAGLLEGIFPGCGLPVKNGPTDKPDPLFHPVRGGVCSIDDDVRIRPCARGRQLAVLRHIVSRYESSAALIAAPKLCSAGSAARWRRSLPPSMCGRRMAACV
jgi:4-phytase/acid phosphatase